MYGTAEVASILNVTRRQVRNLVNDLDAQKSSGCLGFPQAGSDRLRGGAKVVDLDPATEQLMSMASQVLSGGELTAFMAIADAKRFAGDDGTIDADALTDQPPSP